MRIGGRPLAAATAADAARGARRRPVRACAAGRIRVHRRVGRPRRVGAGGAATRTRLPRLRPPGSARPTASSTRPDASCRGPTRRSGWPALADHPLVAVGVEGPIDRPLRLVGDAALPDALLARRAGDPRRPRPPRAGWWRSTRSRWPTAWRGCSPSAGPDRQRLAAATAALRAATIIAGGPGTGKTTTVARLRRAAPSGRGRAPDGRPGRSHGQGGGPAPGGDRSTALTMDPAGPRPRRAAGRLDAAPTARLAPRTRRADSGTTGRTRCPTTSSSSTRRRWSRCR